MDQSESVLNKSDPGPSDRAAADASPGSHPPGQPGPAGPAGPPPFTPEPVVGPAGAAVAAPPPAPAGYVRRWSVCSWPPGCSTSGD
ncbi:hypothetical protein [Micromonospora zhanjiangensis]